MVPRVSLIERFHCLKCLKFITTVKQLLYLSIAFKFSCSVDKSGLIIVKCQEADGDIDKIYCSYDNGPMESCI